MGKRKIDVDGNFYISGEDATKYQRRGTNQTFRIRKYFDHKTRGRIRRRVCKRWRH